MKEELIRVLIVDDHVAVREAFASLIGYEPDMQVVGQAGSREAAMSLNLATCPHLVLLDFQLSDGPSTPWIKDLISAAHAPRVIMLSGFAASSNVFAALDAGASGYLLKSNPADDLLQGLRKVAKGGRAFAEELATRQQPDRAGLLTARELRTLALVAEGRSNEAIARMLNISLGTVKTHIHHLLEKLSARSRVEAIVRSKELGLLPP